MKYNKIIFLDIDGVMNVCTRERDVYGSLFHKQFNDNLRRVIDSTGAKIVISSSWRHSGLKAMQDMWKNRGLAGEVVDVTPNRSSKYYDEPNFKNLPFHERLERGFEIQDWMDKNPVEKFAIADDDTDMLESQMYAFVCTADNWHHTDHVEGYGLTIECANQLINILNSK